MELSTTATIVVPAAPERVWDILVDPAALSDVLRPCFPIPGVARAEVEGGGTLEVGRTRLVHLTDGTTGREAVTALAAPEHHAYVLTGIAPPFGWLVTRGVADWRLSAVEGGTHVTWRYTFDASTPLARPLARLVLVPFARFMRAGLASLSRLAAGR
jgi:carbon monoxide dehydrogenase subunit G